MGEKIFVTKTSMPPYEEYIKEIKPLWESHMLTNMGCYHKELEKKLKEYLNAEYVSLMVNGHMSLELVIQAMNFPKGSEVITTPFTFVSTTHAIVRNGLTPVFCDIKMNDYTIDEDKIENLITEKTVAIVPVHVYGNICNVNKIEKIANKYNLKVIYDAAHSFGEKYCNIDVSNFGDASIFSFHATKVFNTIEGGAVVLKNKEYYDRIYNLKNFGIRGEELVVEVGANAKMNEFCAIMGLCNLKYLEKNISMRHEKAKIYIENLKNDQYYILQKFDNKKIKYNYAYMPIKFRCRKERDDIFNLLRNNNIYARKYFFPLTSDSACFKNKYKYISLQNAREVSDDILVLPLYPEIENKAIMKISNIINWYFKIK